MPSSRKARREIVSVVAAIVSGITSGRIVSDRTITDRGAAHLTATNKSAPAEGPVQIVELGCGWGTLLRPLARKLPECTITGYETSPIPYLFSKLSTKILGFKNIEIIGQNFYKADITGADIIVCYLYPGGMGILKDKLTQSPPKPLFYLVSNTFQVYDWRPDSCTFVSDLFGSAIYVYKVRLV